MKRQIVSIYFIICFSLYNQGKTVIVIVHRLSTIYSADKIIVLEKGKLIEVESHDHLMNQKEKYYKLWEQQFPATIEESIVNHV